MEMGFAASPLMNLNSMHPKDSFPPAARFPGEVFDPRFCSLSKKTGNDRPLCSIRGLFLNVRSAPQIWKTRETPTKAREQSVIVTTFEFYMHTLDE